MTTSTRIVPATILIAALAVNLVSFLPTHAQAFAQAAGAQTSPSQPAPSQPASPSETPSRTKAKPAGEPAKIATVDVVGLLEILITSELYFAPRKQEEDRLRAQLTPLEAQLTALKNDIQGADPSKPENQAKTRDYQVKYEEYKQIRAKVQETYQKLLAKQFTDAIDRIRQTAATIAKEKGYTHVVTQKTGKVELTDATKLAEELLARPYLVSPSDADLTEDVRLALNLPEKSNNPTNILNAKPESANIGSSTPPTPPAPRK
jgi:Skp family chaperone for outer membrane proteins